MKWLSESLLTLSLCLKIRGKSIKVQDYSGCQKIVNGSMDGVPEVRPSSVTTTIHFMAFEELAQEIGQVKCATKV